MCHSHAAPVVYCLRTDHSHLPTRSCTWGGAPVTIAHLDTFDKTEQAAVRLTNSVGYFGAGTVLNVSHCKLSSNVTLTTIPDFCIYAMNFTGSRTRLWSLAYVGRGPQGDAEQRRRCAEGFPASAATSVLPWNASSSFSGFRRSKRTRSLPAGWIRLFSDKPIAERPEATLAVCGAVTKASSRLKPAGTSTAASSTGTMPIA